MNAMSVPIQCCNPCPTSETVNIPGPEGTPGDPGAAGINAFTLTTADFNVPNIGDSVTIQVGSSAWATVGQNIFIEGAGTFQITSKPGAASMTVQYLNYGGNTHAGETIAAPAQVSPSGTQPSSTLLPAITSYKTGGSQALSNSSVQLLSGSIVLAARTYLLLATYRLDYDVATFASPENIALKLREVVNGPADIANALVGLETPTTTTKTGTFIQGAFPAVTYAAAAGDTIEMFGTIDATPYAGSLKAVELSLVAIPLF
jgi:hypothetical protein